MSTTQVEFAVQMTCNSCVKSIKSALSNVKGIDNVDISLETETVVVKSSLPVSVLQEKIESTGRKAVLKGYGGSSNNGMQAAVAMLGGDCGFGLGQIKGIIRFVQTDEKTCVIDGTIDGLSPGLHGLHVHEYGDISKGCDRVGNHFSLLNTSHGAPDNEESKRHTGDLGNIGADSQGRAQFRLLDPVLKISDLIGRTVVVTENADDLGKGGNKQSLIDGNAGKRLACGIIARSAGLFENPKKICACDGVSLWDERDKPLAGPGRREPSSHI